MHSQDLTGSPQGTSGDLRGPQGSPFVETARGSRRWGRYGFSHVRTSWVPVSAKSHRALGASRDRAPTRGTSWGSRVHVIRRRALNASWNHVKLLMWRSRVEVPSGADSKAGRWTQGGNEGGVLLSRTGGGQSRSS